MSEIDYTRHMKKKPGPEAKVTPLPDRVPGEQEAKYRTKRFLQAVGYDSVTVDSLVSPNQPDTTDLGKMFTNVAPLPEGERAVEETVFELAEQLRQEGIEISPEQQEAWGRYLSGMGTSLIRYLATDRKRLNEIHEWVGDRAAGVFGTAALNISLGLGLLDIATRANTSFKLRYVNDEARRAALEQKVMPVVSIETPNGARHFSTGTSASLYLLSQKAQAFVESNIGGITERAGRAAGIEAIEDIGRRTKERGKERKALLPRQVTGLVSNLGQRFTWQDVDEANNPERWDHFYKWMGDASGYDAGMAAGTISIMTAGLDTVVDPTLVFAEVPARILPFLRMGVKAASPGKHAKTFREISRFTMRYEDAVDAVKASDAHVASIEMKMKDEALIALGAAGKAREKEVMGELVKAGKVSEETAKKWFQARRQLAEDRTWFHNHWGEVGDAVPMYLKIPKRNPKYVDQNASKQHIRDMYGGDPPAQMSDEVIDTMAKERMEALTHDAWQGPGFDLGDEALEAATHARRSWGPDNTEEFGRGFEHIAKGGFVDDITSTRATPEYQVTPATPVAMINWRAAALTEAENAFVLAQDPMTLGKSSLVSLMRQERLAKKAYGAARQLGDKAKIKVWDRRIKGIQRTIKRQKEDIAKGKDMKLEEFDEDFLPAPVEPMQSNPERFNRWLQKAGNSVVRSLYPNGIRYNFWHSRLGRIIGPMREPQRFFEIYDPAAWDRIRGGMLNADQWEAGMMHKARQILERGGVLVKRKKFDPVKHFSPYKINEDRMERLAELLDAPAFGGREVRAQLTAQELTRAKTALKADKKLMQAHDEMREFYDGFANMYGLSEDTEVRRMTGYLRHAFTDDLYAGGIRPPEMDGLPVDAAVFASHLLPRSGNATDYSKNVVALTDGYIRVMTRKIMREPVYEDILLTTKAIAAKHKNPALAEYGADFVAQLKGQPTFHQRKIDRQLAGALNHDGKIVYRPGSIERRLMGISSLAHMGMLAGNPRYPVMQMGTGVATTVGRYGLFETLNGLLQFATPEGQAAAKAAGTYKAFYDVIESPGFKWYDKLMRGASKFATEKIPSVSPIGIMPNSKAEEAIRGMTFFAALKAMMTKHGFSTWDEALEAGQARQMMFQALRSSEEVNHIFGPMGRSPWLTQKLGQGGSVFTTQFLSFTWKQTDELMAQASRNPGHIMQYLAMSGYVSRIAAQAWGIDMTKYLGFGYVPEKPDEITSPGIDMMMQLVEFAAALGSHDQMRISEAGKQLSRTATGFFPGMAGWRAVTKGFERLETGELRTEAGRFHRPVDFAKTLPPPTSGKIALEAIARSIKPDLPTELPESLLFEGQPVRPQYAGELIPNVFGQRPLRETLTARSREAFRHEKRKMVYQKMRWVDEYVDALRAEDQDAARNLLLKLAEPPFDIRISGRSAIEREIIARSIAENFRMINPKLGGDPNMFDVWIHLFEQNGIGRIPEQPEVR